MRYRIQMKCLSKKRPLVERMMYWEPGWQALEELAGRVLKNTPVECRPENNEYPMYGKVIAKGHVAGYWRIEEVPDPCRKER